MGVAMYEGCTCPCPCPCPCTHAAFQAHLKTEGRSAGAAAGLASFFGELG